jgi:3-hydroxyacyl-[acyl-carrier-protein] dehydratase
MIEGMAQTGGILLGDKYDFEHIVILAKIPRITFHSWVTPGETIIYTARLLDARLEGGLVSVEAHVGERLVAEGEIFFAHADQSADKVSLGRVDQKNFVFSMSLMRVMDVGRESPPPRQDAPAAGTS